MSDNFSSEQREGGREGEREGVPAPITFLSLLCKFVGEGGGELEREGVILVV